MRNDIEELHERVQAAVDEGVTGTTATGYSAQLAKRVKESTVIPLVLAAFARYGKSGRFHHGSSSR